MKFVQIPSAFKVNRPRLVIFPLIIIKFGQLSDSGLFILRVYSHLAEALTLTSMCVLTLKKNILISITTFTPTIIASSTLVVKIKWVLYGSKNVNDSANADAQSEDSFDEWSFRVTNRPLETLFYKVICDFTTCI